MGITEKFKVRDVVWCKAHDRYLITTYHVKCRIVVILPSGNPDIRVKVLEGDYKGKTFWASSDYFEIALKDAQWV